MSRTLMMILAATLVFTPGVVSAETSTDAPHPAVSANPTSVADTVTQAIASEDLQRAALARLEQAGQWKGLSERVAALEAEFDALTAGAMTHELALAPGSYLVGVDCDRSPQLAANGCIGHERADLVLAGCAILEAIRRAFPAPRIRIADRGLREGMLVELMRADRAHQEGRV